MSEEITAAIQPIDYTACPSCDLQVSTADAFCGKCGYPLQGTTEEQDEFKRLRVHKHIELDDMYAKVRSASNTMFILSGIFALFALFYYGTVSEEEKTGVLIANLVLAVLYVGLGFWSRVQPVAGIISALALYAIVQVVIAIEDPTSIFKGILWKVLIIMYLVKGLRSAYEAKRLQQLHNL